MQKITGALGLLFIVFLLPALANAQITGATSLASSVSSLCASVSDIMPIAAVLAVFASAAIYAVGQFTGAETRARTVVWATTLFTGAIVAVLIQTVTPAVLSSVSGQTVRCSAANSSSIGQSPACNGVPYDGDLQECCGGEGGNHLCAVDRCCLDGCAIYDQEYGWTC